MHARIGRAISLAGALTLAGVAHAQIPSPGNHQITPSCIVLVNGDATGVAANPAGAFTVLARNLANEPIANGLVLIDFSLCGTADVRLQRGQAHDPALTQDCALRTVSKRTDANGFATFVLIGGGSSAGGPGFPSRSTGCARVFLDGVLIAMVTVGAHDQNGHGGVTPADVAAMIADVLSPGYETRSDVNCSLDLSPADVSRCIAVLFSEFQQPLGSSFCNL